MFPPPDDVAQLPTWSNYVRGQLTQASLGLLSPRIVIAGATDDGLDVTLHFYVDHPVVDDYPEIAEIVEQFEDLTGDLLNVTVEIKEWHPAAVDHQVVWTYRRWLGEEVLSG